MSIILNTEFDYNTGFTKVTFPNGEEAGLITNHRQRFQFTPKGGQPCKERLVIKSAEYDALIWAEEREARRRYGMSQK